MVPVHCCEAAAIGTCVVPERYVPLAARTCTVPVSGSSAPPRSAAVPCAVTVPIVWPAGCVSDAEYSVGAKNVSFAVGSSLASCV